MPTPAARRRPGSSLRGQPGPGERSRLTSSRHPEPPDHHHHRQPPPPPSYLAVLSPRPGLRRCPRPQHRLAGPRPSSRQPPLRPRPPLRLTAPGGACPPPRLPSAGRARHPAAAGGGAAGRRGGGTPAQRPPSPAGGSVRRGGLRAGLKGLVTAVPLRSRSSASSGTASPCHT